MVRVAQPVPPRTLAEERWQSEGGRNVGQTPSVPPRLPIRKPASGRESRKELLVSFRWVCGFKFLCTAMFVVGVATVVLAWVGWGFWAAFSHVHGIVLTLVGGGLILLSRRHRPRVDAGDEHVPFAGYPEGQLFAIVDTQEKADQALAELRAAQIQVREVYRGKLGAAELDSEGMMHGIEGELE